MIGSIHSRFISRKRKFRKDLQAFDFLVPFMSTLLILLLNRFLFLAMKVLIAG